MHFGLYSLLLLLLTFFTRSEREVFIYERKTWECVRLLEILQRSEADFSVTIFSLSRVFYEMSQFLVCYNLFSEFTINRHLNQSPLFYPFLNFWRPFWRGYERQNAKEIIKGQRGTVAEFKKKDSIGFNKNVFAKTPYQCLFINLQTRRVFYRHWRETISADCRLY